MSKSIITFTKAIAMVDDSFSPIPASKMIPDWYKKTDSYEGPREPYTQTIKKCIPIFDAVTAGYILKTPIDFWVKIVDGEQHYYTPDGAITNGSPLISYHSVKQAPFHPQMNQRPYPKFINPFSIKTEKGYSCLFIPPMHHPNEYFHILSAIVDTDNYTSQINFPFTINDPNFEGLIPAGTPMAQCIPFKRNSFEMKFGNEENLKESIKSENFVNSMFFNRYKQFFWNKKEYK